MHGLRGRCTGTAPCSVRTRYTIGRTPIFTHLLQLHLATNISCRIFYNSLRTTTPRAAGSSFFFLCTLLTLMWHQHMQSTLHREIRGRYVRDSVVSEMHYVILHTRTHLSHLQEMRKMEMRCVENNPRASVLEGRATGSAAKPAAQPSRTLHSLRATLTCRRSAARPNMTVFLMAVSRKEASVRSQPGCWAADSCDSASQARRADSLGGQEIVE